MINFLDTSAILAGAMDSFFNIYISPLAISELENIKTEKNKDEDVKFLARRTVREMIQNKEFKYTCFSQKEVMKELKQHAFLSDINDHHILCEAILLNKQFKRQVHFITADGALYLFAKQIKDLIVTFYVPKDKELTEQYCGWRKCYPDIDTFSEVYMNLNNNIFNCQANEFAIIYEDEQVKDVLFWNGLKYRPLNYKEFTSVLGERIKPRNLEQKMYLDLLQNKDVPIKLCLARFGTGKSFLALNYALHEVQTGRFDKIIFVKNNLEVKGAGKLGTLPGDTVSKLYPWLLQIEDMIGIEKFEEYLDNGQIEPAHLSSLRGRDLKNCCIIVDEAENLLTSNIQLLLGRVAEGSEIIFCADVKQCDYYDEKMSGIPRMIERLYGKQLFGMVKLLKTERSKVAAMADLLD